MNRFASSLLAVLILGLALWSVFGKKERENPVEHTEEIQFVPIADGVNMAFCKIPAGQATLGSPVDEDKRRPDEQERTFTSETRFRKGCSVFWERRSALR